MRARLPTWHAKITLLRYGWDTRGLWLRMTSLWLAPRVVERPGRSPGEKREGANIPFPVLHSHSPLPFFKSRETYVGLIQPTKRTFTHVLHKRQVTAVLPFLLRSCPVSSSFFFVHVGVLTKRDRDRQWDQSVFQRSPERKRKKATAW